MCSVLTCTTATRAKGAVIDHVKSHAKIYAAITVIASLALILAGVAGGAALAGAPGLVAISATAVGLPYALVGVGALGVGGLVIVVVAVASRAIQSDVRPLDYVHPQITNIHHDLFLLDTVELISENMSQTLLSHGIEQDHIDGVNKFLGKFVGLSPTHAYNNQDVHNFYYHLASITKKVMKLNKDVQSVWENYLMSINGKSLGSIAIDCSMELARLEGSLPELFVVALNQEEITNKELYKIGGICCACFDDWKTRSTTHIKKYLYQGKSTLYVIRDRLSDEKEILGLVVLQQQDSPTSQQHPSLLIHTLARAPHAVKLGMTELLAGHLKSKLVQKDFSKIYCEVRRDNPLAQRIYQNLGFVVTSACADGLSDEMEYQPPEKQYTLEV